MLNLKIGLIGHGKVGKHLKQLALADKEITLVGTYSRNTNTTREEALSKAEVLIDFSLPEALEENLEFAKKGAKPLVIGTTGFSKEMKNSIEQASDRIPILFSPNFSLSLVLCLEAVHLFSSRLEDADIDIVEIHHKEKKDCPSGTALALKASMQKEAKIHSLRTADTIGEHQVIFSCAGERITLKHEITSRDAFALGAIKAAKFLSGKTPGLYTLKDLYA